MCFWGWCWCALAGGGSALFALWDAGVTLLCPCADRLPAVVRRWKEDKLAEKKASGTNRNVVQEASQFKLHLSNGMIACS